MRKLAPYIALALLLAEVVLIFLSWLLSAALPASGVRSMLSGEGLRWLMGQYGEMLATPLLSWIILAAMAIGCLRSCGLWHHSQPLTYRERHALLIGGGALLLCLLSVSLLTFMPHAVLRSVTGALFPSPFSYSLVPVLSFSLCIFGIVYGVVAGTFRSLRHVYEALLDGIRWSAPVILFYILILQLYESLLFVLG